MKNNYYLVKKFVDGKFERVYRTMHYEKVLERLNKLKRKFPGDIFRINKY